MSLPLGVRTASSDMGSGADGDRPGRSMWSVVLLVVAGVVVLAAVGVTIAALASGPAGAGTRVRSAQSRVGTAATAGTTTTTSASSSGGAGAAGAAAAGAAGSAATAGSGGESVTPTTSAAAAAGSATSAGLTCWGALGSERPLGVGRRWALHRCGRAGDSQCSRRCHTERRGSGCGVARGLGRGGGPFPAARRAVAEAEAAQSGAG